MLNVLWLCSWYPNNLFPFDGDFVQRHAQAASLYNKINVIKLTPDPGAKNVTKVTRRFQEWPNLTETFIYYPKPRSFVGKAVAYFRWYSLYKYAVEEYIEKNGKPDLVHVHVPYKAGIVAQQIKRKFKIPYVVTEHWGGYNNVIPGNYKEREPRFKNVIKDTFKKSSGLHTPSEYLAQQIQGIVTKVPYTVIPNAVNVDYFNTNQRLERNGKFRLLHISNGVPVKNVQGIIEAFNQLDNDDYEFTIIGFPKELNDIYKKLNPSINFTGEIPYKEVAGYLNQADALVLFSDMENSPCVIGEALCCGVPVVAANVGGIPELLDEFTGILIEPGNINSLLEAIHTLKGNTYNYSKIQTAEAAMDRFSYQQISFETDLWYRSILMAGESGGWDKVLPVPAGSL